MQIKLIIAALCASLLLSACGASANGGAVGAVENYVNALAAKDKTTLIANSCANWEDAALLELDSFAIVDVSVADLSCKQSGADGDLALVDCAGRFDMSYNGEPQSLDLSNRTYEVVNQSGDWLVCGVR
ncbi:MAG: hypothetical protein LC099_08220 [Anaerolineales bacterium]|nr:hypothetical protein [Anaerolineales bacterium]